jgi:hypothetical protein
MITKKLVKRALRCSDKQAEEFRYLWARPKTNTAKAKVKPINKKK